MRSPVTRPWWRRGFPGVFITSPGGGGASTVTTDGVTITGTGSAGSPIALLAAKTDTSLQGAGTVASPLGILSVGKNSTLTGAGTAGTPLGVNGWPLTFFTYGYQNSTITLGGINQIYGSGFVLPFSLTFAHIEVSVSTTDASNNYDFGLYTAAGALVANVGPRTLPSGGNQVFATLQGAQTIAPGLYIFAMTGAATTAKLGAGGNIGLWLLNANIGSSTAATLPNSISAPTLGPNLVGFWFSLY